MIRHVGAFFGQLRGNSLSNGSALIATDNDHVELTAVCTHAAGVERQFLRSECQ